MIGCREDVQYYAVQHVKYYASQQPLIQNFRLQVSRIGERFFWEILRFIIISKHFHIVVASIVSLIECETTW